jgi:NMD protein affecting ribosome stability and mRNA decay
MSGQRRHWGKVTSDQCQRCAKKESSSLPFRRVQFRAAGVHRRWRLCLPCAEFLRDTVLAHLGEVTL